MVSFNFSRPKICINISWPCLFWVDTKYITHFIYSVDFMFHRNYSRTGSVSQHKHNYVVAINVVVQIHYCSQQVQIIVWYTFSQRSEWCPKMYTVVDKEGSRKGWKEVQIEKRRWELEEVIGRALLEIVHYSLLSINIVLRFFGGFF